MDKFFFSMMVLGAASSSGQMPFWEYSNRFDLMPLTSGYTSVIETGISSGQSRDFRYDFGATFALRGDTYDWTSFVPGQLYAGVGWKHISLDIGMKNPEQLYCGASPTLGSLSSTSGNLIMSGNARNMPGYTITLSTVGIPYTKDHFQICARYGDYVMTDKRIEGRLYTHNTQICMIVNFWRFSLGFGLDHWAQWYGNSFKNYFRMISGSRGGKDSSPSDQVNTIGNQLGAEKMFLKYKGDGWSAEIRHDIPYDDKSGMRFSNFPDGMNYFVFSFDDKDRWVSDVVFEFDYTMYQSGPIHENEFDSDGNHIPWQPGMNYFGMDNYFNNAILQSAWTHYGMSIGTPLFYPTGTKDGSWTRRIPCKGVENNRIKAHHLGISGKIARLYPYRLMASYSKCYGIYEVPYAGESAAQKPWKSVKETPLRQFSLGFNMEIPLLGNSLVILPGIYWDKGQVLVNSFGASLGLKYVINK